MFYCLVQILLGDTQEEALILTQKLKVLKNGKYYSNSGVWFCMYSTESYMRISKKQHRARKSGHGTMESRLKSALWQLENISYTHQFVTDPTEVNSKSFFNCSDLLDQTCCSQILMAGLSDRWLSSISLFLLSLM